MMEMAGAAQSLAAAQEPGRDDDDYGRVLESATTAIGAAETFRSPYPHIFFRNFFPADFYRLLLERFPARDRFVQLNGEATRWQYNLYDERRHPGAEQGQSAWRIVSRVLTSPEIEAALRVKLEEGFRIRANGSRDEWPIPMFPRPVVYSDLDGYAIKPHADTRRKVLTMQIYLPADETQRDLGTTIYKISPRGVFSWKTYGLAKEKTLPFLPNTGYAFVVIHPAYSLFKSSWHGREAISVPADKPRLSILNTYYREPAEEAGAGM